MPGPTPFADLNELMEDLAARAQAILGADFVGAYLQGSFALGDADEFSDCDFLVVARDTLSQEQEHAVRALHAEIPDRDGRWCQLLQGSYAPATDLATNERIGTDWLYIGHGLREMRWSSHCNKVYHRWILHERGIAIRGAPARQVVAPIPTELLRENARRQLPGLLEEVGSWAFPFRVAFTQRYLVATYCRILFIIAHGVVPSKPVALRWALETLDPAWRPLLTQVLDDRPRGSDFSDRSRPGSIKASLRFGEYAVRLGDLDPATWSTVEAARIVATDRTVTGWLGSVAPAGTVTVE